MIRRRCNRDLPPKLLDCVVCVYDFVCVDHVHSLYCVGRDEECEDLRCIYSSDKSTE